MRLMKANFSSALELLEIPTGVQALEFSISILAIAYIILVDALAPFVPQASVMSIASAQ